MLENLMETLWKIHYYFICIFKFSPAWFVGVYLKPFPAVGVERGSLAAKVYCTCLKRVWRSQNPSVVFPLWGGPTQTHTSPEQPPTTNLPHRPFLIYLQICPKQN